MTRLGFTIKVTIQGNQTPTITINAGEWTNHVSDVRNIISVANTVRLPQQDITILISFTNEGMIINLIRKIDGRVNDNTAAWIFIPADADISGKAVAEIIATVKACISKTSIDALTRQQLQDIFSQEYPSLKHHLTYAPSAADGYAYRLTGEYYTLQELLGEDRYQKYYTEYKAIFLIDAEYKEKMPPQAGLVDLTNKQLVKYCSLLPHDMAEVKAILGSDVRLCTDKEGTPFDKEISGFKDKTIVFYALRKGFETIRRNYVFKSLGLSLDLKELKQELVWQRIIRKGMFEVIDAHSKQPLNHCSISINGTQLGTSKLLIEEEDCKRAKVEVTAKGYDKVEKDLNLLHDNSIPIELMREKRTYEYKLQLENGNTADMKLETRERLSEYKSPLVGYEINNDVLCVIRKKSRFALPSTKKLPFAFRTKKQKTVAIGVALAGVVLLAAIITLSILLTKGNKSSKRIDERTIENRGYNQNKPITDQWEYDDTDAYHNDSAAAASSDDSFTEATKHPEAKAADKANKKDKAKSDTKPKVKTTKDPSKNN